MSQTIKRNNISIKIWIGCAAVGAPVASQLRPAVLSGIEHVTLMCAKG